MDRRERFNRAYDFLKYEKIISKQDDVAQAMKASRANISSALSGRESALTDSFLTRFSRAFKQISLEWLLSGEGQMLTMEVTFKDENIPQVLESLTDKDVLEEQGKMTERIWDVIRKFGHTPKTFALKADIQVELFLMKLKGEVAWSVADINKIRKTFKIRKGWLVDGEGQQFCAPDEILENIPIRSHDARVGVPYYNVDFKLGFDMINNDQTNTPSYYISFEPYNKADCWCNASGESMAPTIANGDLIALKEVRDPQSCLINDDIYAIVTLNELRTIKRIKDQGDSILLIPDNKEYSEQTIRKDMILKVFRVMGSVKRF